MAVGAAGLIRLTHCGDRLTHCGEERTPKDAVWGWECQMETFNELTPLIPLSVSLRSAATMEDKRNIQIIEWEHLDKKKFYVFGVAMTMMIRVSVYPFTLIRTRLQVQKGKSLYHGTFDAFIKILRAEGVSGLYRGFLVNTFTLISGQCYVTTYELTRKFVADYSQSNTVKSLVAGGSASLVAQSITVPIDVVSQHLMMQRKGEKMGRFQVQGQQRARGCWPLGRPRTSSGRSCGLTGFVVSIEVMWLRCSPTSPTVQCGGPSTTSMQVRREQERGAGFCGACGSCDKGLMQVEVGELMGH